MMNFKFKSYKERPMNAFSASALWFFRRQRYHGMTLRTYSSKNAKTNKKFYETVLWDLLSTVSGWLPGDRVKVIATSDGGFIIRKTDEKESVKVGVKGNGHLRFRYPEGKFPQIQPNKYDKNQYVLLDGVQGKEIKILPEITKGGTTNLMEVNI